MVFPLFWFAYLEKNFTVKVHISQCEAKVIGNELPLPSIKMVFSPDLLIGIHGHKLKAVADSFIKELCLDFMFCFSMICVHQAHLDLFWCLIFNYQCLEMHMGHNGQSTKPESSVPRGQFHQEHSRSLKISLFYSAFSRPHAEYCIQLCAFP